MKGTFLPAATAMARPAAEPSANRVRTIVGTLTSDVIAGTSGDDVICAIAGNDHIRAGAGDDTVYGSDGEEDGLHEWVKGRPYLFVPLDEDVQNAAAGVLARYPALVKASARRTEADPFVIARAQVRGNPGRDG